MANVLVEEQSLKNIGDAIRTKNGLTTKYTPAEMKQAILDNGASRAEVESKDVNFYDTVGRRLYSYTLAEIQALTKLPDVPTKEGLINGAWNWTLAQLKEHNNICDVGLTYETDDGTTRVYIDIDEDAPDYKFIIYGHGTVANGVKIDWGDGNSEYFGTSAQAKTHTYANAGKYTIKITVESGKFWAGGSTQYGFCGALASYSLFRLRPVKRIEIGSNFIPANYCFARLCNLEEITISKTMTRWNNASMFYYCSELKQVTIPYNSSTVLTSYTFARMSNLKALCMCYGVISFTNNFCSLNAVDRIALSEKFTKDTLPSYTSNENQRLKQVHLSSKVKTIDGYAFQNSFALNKINLDNVTTKIGRSAFNGCNNLTNIGNLNAEIIDGQSFYATGLTGKLKIKAKNIGTSDNASGGRCFGSDGGLEKVWINNSCEYINDATNGCTNYMGAPFYGCRSNLVIYLEATEAPTAFGTYWNYISASTQLTVVYGVSESEFDAL